MLKKITQTLSIPILTSLMLTGFSTPALKPLGLNIEPLSPISAQTSESQTGVQVYEKASPAVVTITYKNQNNTYWGSGFIVNHDGLVLTNSHVVKQASKTVKVILANGTELIADIIGFEGKGLDLAALKIRNQNNLPTVALAKPNSVKVGESVYAIGTPLDITQFQTTLTSGVVSKVDHKRGLIQHDAAINPGNSGGPLLNAKAEVIGINTQLYNPKENDHTFIGIGLAIAISEAQPFLVALKQGDSAKIAQQPTQTQNQSQILSLPVNGETVTATLKLGDPTLPNNTYTHFYSFEGKAGQQITIEMNSNKIDPALFLYFPANKTLVGQNDDISSKDFNTRLVVTLPQDGVYLVLANAFSKGETGEYQLKAMLK